MKKVIMGKEEPKEIVLDNIDECVPIFAKRKGKLIGMIIYEKSLGWILNIGANLGAIEYHKTRKECLDSCIKYGYEFFIED